MELSTILASILKIFATSPDLCAEVYLDANGEPWTDSIGQTLSRYCQWTGPRAPRLRSHVCCDITNGVAACVLPDPSGACSIGSPYSCKYGKASSDGVICLQPFPDTCAMGQCVKLPEVPPPTQANLLCCTNSACQEIKGGTAMELCEGNGGILSWCDFGTSNEDGTVTCYDY